ncbi:mediator of RNA polymerase II transcription subunit 12 [Glossina fuscipes]|uniref:Mediator of RNA polymerase II transcription subunit 12 n=1 Tax=Glossina fuscipes TaxID=7396 RepID=A0A9C6DIY8_9MUSC|nr:mediator of RNA polymerase II transcription subunit 12 [Glossina fuscipes]KAI9583442.1 hypothetical protein GQX74_005190 [Glossina fuscipes]
MEDLLKLSEKAESYPKELEKKKKEWLENLRKILYGNSVSKAEPKNEENSLPSPSPCQTMKRCKRLSSLDEENAEDNEDSSAKPNRKSNEILLSSASEIERGEKNDQILPVPAPRGCGAIVVAVESDTVSSTVSNSNDKELMPPPLPPSVLENVDSSVEVAHNSSGRPQRAAKLKSEKNLKEPELRGKLRQPAIVNVKVKLEEEQRLSQMKTRSTKADTKADDSVIVLPSKKPSTIEINSTSEDEDQARTSVEKECINTTQTQQTSDGSFEQAQGNARQLRIRVKREKISLTNKDNVKNDASAEATFKDPPSVPLPIKTKVDTSLEEASSSQNSTSTSTTNRVAASKKDRKKKNAVPHKPIKVERLSDFENRSPVASRTRKGGSNRNQPDSEDGFANAASNGIPETDSKVHTSIYEDAVQSPPVPGEELPKTVSAADKASNVNETFNVDRQQGDQCNGTITVAPPAHDATFRAEFTHETFVVDSNLNATATVQKGVQAEAEGNLTFAVTSQNKSKQEEDAVDQKSFETAKDASIPRDNSLITEDESSGQPAAQQLPLLSKIKPATNFLKSIPTSAKAYKMPPVLFNPLVHSPVKMRVEAFENAAVAAKAPTSKRVTRLKKENSAPMAGGNGSSITPTIGKLGNPALGRFLTPTQTSNLTPASGAIKKLPSSASKATMPLHRSATASSLKNSVIAGSSKNLHRENSSDDVHKAFSQSEERKKQREQKHLLAAQQREAKERERAERFAKLAQEREEKLLKKQLEQERKKRELEEINRKLRLQDEALAASAEANKLKAIRAKAAAQEREMLLKLQQEQQMFKQRIMPPPPKLQTKYRFEMLHEDDSTDEEGKTSYKRPPPPTWSRSHERGPHILMQQHVPLDVIDSFFSVQPLTADLKTIFPTIDDRYLKRNSSVLWSTPPRYSELPKY